MIAPFDRLKDPRPRNTTDIGPQNTFLEKTNVFHADNKVLIDVVEQFRWCLNDIKQHRDIAGYDIPTVYLREYVASQSATLAKMAFWMKMAQDYVPQMMQGGRDEINNVSSQLSSGRMTDNALGLLKATSQVVTSAISSLNKKESIDQIYGSRLFGTPTKIEYKFPFFTEDILQRTNNFDDGKSSFGKNFLTDLGAMGGTIATLWGANKVSNIFGRGGGFFGTLFAGGVFGAAAGSAFTPAKTIFELNNGMDNTVDWNSTSNESVTLNIILFNTFNTDDIQRNRSLVELLENQNTPSRRNRLLNDPPVYYDLFIPDVAYFPACYVSDLKVKNVGKIRMLYGQRIPEAYEISMTFSSMFTPSRNMVGLAYNNGVSPVSVVQDIEGAFNLFTNSQNNTPAPPRSTPISSNNQPNGITPISSTNQPQFNGITPRSSNNIPLPNGITPR
jgi:hypothetical protein